MTNPTDNCTCGHSAASHGFNYEESCTIGLAPNDPRDACVCAAFALATPGEVFARDDKGSDEPRPVNTEQRTDGFWLAYDHAAGPERAAGAFPDELSALRYAVENGLQVRYQQWGAI